MDLQNKNIVIGIGSNINPLENLRSALIQLRTSSFFDVEMVSRIYESEALVPDQAPSAWNQKYLNMAVVIKTNLKSLDHVLSELKKIESSLGRSAEYERWAPRNIDLDILYAQSINLSSDILSVPHKEVLKRPFAYLPLMDVMPVNSLSKPEWHETFERTGKAPYNTQVSSTYFLPRFVGILNVTEDSFSDGNQYLNDENFLAQAKKLINDGAEFLDIGAESTRPGAEAVSLEVEYQRLEKSLKLLQKIKAEGFEFKVSVDSRNVEVIQKLVQKFRIDMINDVSGKPSDELV